MEDGRKNGCPILLVDSDRSGKMLARIVQEKFPFGGKTITIGRKSMPYGE